jgi:fatty-acyl-CoA synthase
VFSADAFYHYAEEHLPAYSRPAFVRIVPALEVTGTYKMKKVDLQKAGYDPGLVKDPLFYRNENGHTFSTVTLDIFKEIQGQRIRF